MCRRRRAVVRQHPAEPVIRSPGHRVLTLARELGRGERGFPPTLGECLQMQVFDRELLEQQAVRLGVPESELETIDEHALASSNVSVPEASTSVTEMPWNNTCVSWPVVAT